MGASRKRQRNSTYLHPNLVIGVALLARRHCCHRVDDVNFEKICWNCISIVERLLLDVQAAGGICCSVRLNHHLLLCATNPLITEFLAASQTFSATSYPIMSPVSLFTLRHPRWIDKSRDRTIPGRNAMRNVYWTLHARAEVKRRISLKYTFRDDFITLT